MLAVIVVITLNASPLVFFFGALILFGWAAAELVKILRVWTPKAPLGALLVLMPLDAAALAYRIQLIEKPDLPQVFLLLDLGLLDVIVLSSALVVLWSRVPMKEAAVAIGFLAFAVPYFALPVASLYHLHRCDPWLVLTLIALVAAGDTAAYFIGTWIGRHRLAPVVSPKKSWEGALAGGAAAVAVIAVYCLLRFDELRVGWLVLAAVTSAAAQLGDLVESLIKRGAGVKDSSSVLPGHGGVYDRVDAMMFAAPVFLLGLWSLGHATPGGSPP